MEELKDTRLECSNCNKIFNNHQIVNICSRNEMSNFLFLYFPTTTNKHFFNILSKLNRDHTFGARICIDDLIEKVKVHWSNELHSEYDDGISNYFKHIIG